MMKPIYELRQDHAVLTGCDGTGEILRIPSLIDDVPVIRIAESSFEGNKDLRVVQIPSTIQSIGKAAFSGCEHLMCVTMDDISRFPPPDTVEARLMSEQGGFIAFLPPALSTIEADAFRKTALQQVHALTGDILTIGTSAFQCCPHLWEVRLRCKEAQIADHGFAACKNLKVFAAPYSSCKLGRFAFGECRNLTYFFSDTPPEYAADTFYACPCIQSLRQYDDGRFTVNPSTLYQLKKKGGEGMKHIDPERLYRQRGLIKKLRSLIDPEPWENPATNPTAHALNEVTHKLSMDPNHPELLQERLRLLQDLKDQGISPFKEDNEEELF